MDYTIEEVLQFIEENDVRFVRLTFCDMFGYPKNIAVPASRLGHVFRHGVSFDASVVDGFMNVEETDLFLHPDPVTLAVLPWRPQQGRVVRLFCDIKYPDGRPFEGDGRYLLKQAVAHAAARGYACRMGAECEFYLFQCDDDGSPTKVPHDKAGCFDIAPLDKAENIRREICLTLDEMGIWTSESHHKHGPGQNEISFISCDALNAADNFFTFKSVAKTVASLNGLFASFLPRPLVGFSGSGMHLNMYLAKDGVSVFNTRAEKRSKEADSFIAGILDHIRDITAFLNPIPNSYERFGSFEAPQYVTWSLQNRSQLIRIPDTTGEEYRAELRSPDMACNPYFAIALILYAGIDGIERGLQLPEPADFNHAKINEFLSNTARLPADLGEAVALARQSDFLAGVMPQNTLKKYLDAKEREWKQFAAADDPADYFDKRYFPVI